MTNAWKLKLALAENNIEWKTISVVLKEGGSFASYHIPEGIENENG